MSSEAAVPCGFKAGRLETGRAQRVEVRLSDETTLWVNHDSIVQLLPDRPRTLRLDGGEALIEVVRQGSLGPLQVLLPTGRVEVVGTKLQIKVQPQVALVDVIRGKVLVHSASGSEPR